MGFDVLLFKTILFIILGYSRTNARNGLKMELQRSLETDGDICSQHSNCGTCEDDPDCTFLNGECIINPLTSIANEMYNQTAGAHYCSNALDSGTLSISDQENQKLNLYPLSSANAEDKSICEWRVYMYDNLKLTLELERNPNNYEDLYIFAYNTLGSQTFTSKDFSDCSSSIQKLELEKVGYIIVRFKILNAHSNYNLNIHQSEKSSSIAMLALIFIIGAAIGLCFVLCGILCFFRYQISGYIFERNQRRRTIMHFEARLATKDKRISKTMECMIHDEFQNIEAKYEHDECVVCLEKFTPDSKVHVTNECAHIFHTQCLFEWYDNMPVVKDLCCPHCNSKNREYNEKEQSIRDCSAESESDEIDISEASPGIDQRMLPQIHRTAIIPLDEDI